MGALPPGFFLTPPPKAPGGAVRMGKQLPEGFVLNDAQPAPQVSNESAKGNRELSLGETADDMVRSGVAGLAKGVVGLGGMPGDMTNLAVLGIGKLRGDSPEQIAAMQSNNPLPTSASLQDRLEKNVTGKLYEPRSTAGDYAETAGEFAPAVIAGPGGVGRKIAMTVIPGVASEAAGKAFKDTPLEPAARVAGALAGGLGAAGSEALATGKILNAAAKTSRGLQQAKTDLYTHAENTVGKETVPLKEFGSIVRKMNGEASKRGIGGPMAEVIDNTYSQANGARTGMTKIMEDAAKGDRPLPTYNDLEHTRQALRDVVEKNTDVKGHLNADGQLARTFIEHIDHAVAQTPFQDARKAYSTLRKTQRIEDAIKTAETRTSSKDLAYKNEFQKIVRENIKRPLFSPAEMEAIKKVAGNGRINNLLEGVGRLGFGSKSPTAGTIATAAAAYLAHLIGIDPLTAATTTAAVTSGAKALGTRMTKARAGTARDIVAMGGDKAALDAKLLAAKAGANGRRAVVAANSLMQAKPRRPLEFSIYDTPSGLPVH